MTYALFAENVCQDQVVESKNANRSASRNRASSLLKLVTGEAAVHLCCQLSRAIDTACSPAPAPGGSCAASADPQVCTSTG